MAGIQWSGGKCHGATEAKAILRHNDKAQRMEHGHSNPDINTDLTPLNVSYYGQSYNSKISRYDKQVSTAKCKRISTGKNATVTMQDLCIYCPKGMMNEQTGEYDYALIRSWFRDVGDILANEYGEDFVEMDVHFDEVHLYIDSGTEEYIWSRVHGHAAIVPTVHEKSLDENGKEQDIRVLNAKKFCSKSRIIGLNCKIHDMTKQKYHMPYLDGSKKKGTGQVEDKKRESAEALAKRQKEIEEREKALARREQEIQELIVLGRRAKAKLLSESFDDDSQKSTNNRPDRRLPDISF